MGPPTVTLGPIELLVTHQRKKLLAALRTHKELMLSSEVCSGGRRNGATPIAESPPYLSSRSRRRRLAASRTLWKSKRAAERRSLSNRRTLLQHLQHGMTKPGSCVSNQTEVGRTAIQSSGELSTQDAVHSLITFSTRFRLEYLKRPWRCSQCILIKKC